MKRKTTLILTFAALLCAAVCFAQEQHEASSSQTAPSETAAAEPAQAPAAQPLQSAPQMLPQDAQKPEVQKAQSPVKAEPAQKQNITASEPAVTQPPEAAPLSAREKYDKGDFVGAAQDYEEQISSSAKPSAFLFYNLANSYFKQGEADKAVLNYYKAFRILPRDKDIKRNLKFALASTGQTLLPEGMPQAAFDVYHFFSLAEMQGLLWFFIWTGGISFCVFLFSRKKKTAKKICLISVAAAAFFGVWYFALVQSEGARMAVVTVLRAEVRSGPAQRFPVSLSVPRAYLVTVLDSKGEWAEVQLHTDGAPVGWILKKSIEEIN